MLTDTWRFTMLGQFVVRIGKHNLTRFRTHKTGALLAYLTLPPEPKQERKVLAQLFWPEALEENALQSLRTELCSLRKQLMPTGIQQNSILITDRNSVSICQQAITTDVNQFEAACRSAVSDTQLQWQLEWCEHAIQLYGGELLPGYSEDWVQERRLQLQTLHCDMLCLLGEVYVSLNAPDEAVHAYEKLVAVRPQQEEVWLALMQLLNRMGRHNMVVQRFHALERILKEQGQKPSLETLKQLNVATRSASVFELEVQTPIFHIGCEVRKAEDAAIQQRDEGKRIEVADEHAPISQPHVHLPLYLDSFIGREEEIALLGSLLTSDPPGFCRLVTITGLAGSGKTRLAVETARQLTGLVHNRGGFVSLAGLSSDDDIVGAARDALCPQDPDAPKEPLQQIKEALGEESALLILDNYEHLLPGHTGVVLQLLEALPGLRLLITSRQPLQLKGEQLFRLEPFPIPESARQWRNEEELAALSDYACVQLFVERARLKRYDFKLKKSNAVAVAALCRRVEGLPLAIELSAAKSGTLTPAQMLKRLDDRFQFLVSRYADQPERHRSIYLAIDSSYSALPPDLQRFFARLCIFPSNFTLEAASHIGATDVQTADDWLTELRERSLIVDEDCEETIRFRLLESIQEFALHRLIEDGDYEATRLRHLDYYLGYAETCALQLSSSRQHETLQNMTLDQENLQTALEYSLLSTGEWNKALRFVCALKGFWYRKGLHQEGNDRFEQVLKAGAQMPAEIRRKALHGAAMMAFLCADFVKAQIFWTECLAISLDLRDEPGALQARGNLASVAIEQHDYPQARSLFEFCLMSYRAQGDNRRAALVLANLAIVARGEQDNPLCYKLQRECVELFRLLEDAHNLTLALNNLADTLIVLKDYVAAHTVLAEAVREGLTLNNPRYLAHSLSNYVTLAIRENRMEYAALLIGAMEALRDRIQYPLPSSAQSDYQRERQAVVQFLGEARFAEIWLTGSRMSPEELGRFILG